MIVTRGECTVNVQYTQHEKKNADKPDLLRDLSHRPAAGGVGWGLADGDANMRSDCPNNILVSKRVCWHQQTTRSGNKNFVGVVTGHKPRQIIRIVSVGLIIKSTLKRYKSCVD